MPIPADGEFIKIVDGFSLFFSKIFFRNKKLGEYVLWVFTINLILFFFIIFSISRQLRYDVERGFSVIIFLIFPSRLKKLIILNLY